VLVSITPRLLLFLVIVILAGILQILEAFKNIKLRRSALIRKEMKYRAFGRSGMDQFLISSFVSRLDISTFPTKNRIHIKVIYLVVSFIFLKLSQ
tara:strand:+ start:699 stop:983 length:285 start_codon:yes stop_codon:yes gene_type:complete